MGRRLCFFLHKLDVLEQEKTKSSTCPDWAVWLGKFRVTKLDTSTPLLHPSLGELIAISLYFAQFVTVIASLFMSHVGSGSRLRFFDLIPLIGRPPATCPAMCCMISSDSKRIHSREKKATDLEKKKKKKKAGDVIFNNK
jgi:hypothetical protein